MRRAAAGWKLGRQATRQRPQAARWPTADSSREEASAAESRLPRDEPEAKVTSTAMPRCVAGLDNKRQCLDRFHVLAHNRFQGFPEALLFAAVLRPIARLRVSRSLCACIRRRCFHIYVFEKVYRRPYFNNDTFDHRHASGTHGSIVFAFAYWPIARPAAFPDGLAFTFCFLTLLRIP